MTYRLLSLCLPAVAFMGALCVNGGSLQAEQTVSDPFSEGPAMHFAIVRSADPACEPNCAEWIFAEGVIRPGTEDEFRKILDSLGKRKLPLLIHSIGGNAASAMAMGRMLKARQMDVAVSKTEFRACTAPARDCRKARPAAVLRGEPHSRGAICGSACTFILAAGAHRFVAPWAGVGVHQGTGYEKRVKRLLIVKVRRFLTPLHEIVTQKTVVGEKDTSRIVKLDAPSPVLMGKVDAYLKEMGMSGELQTLMAATAPKDVHWLSHAELNRTHMATDYYGSEQLIAQLSLARMSDAKDAPSAVQAGRSDDDPKAEVTSLGYGLVKMQSAADQDVTLLIEFLHHKDAPTVEISALVEDRAGFIPTANLGLTLQFGIFRSTEIMAVSALPTAPLLGRVSSADICREKKFIGFVKFTLVQLTSGAKISGPPAFFDIRPMTSVPDLLADICKPDANTADKKLDRLWH